MFYKFIQQFTQRAKLFLRLETGPNVNLDEANRLMAMGDKRAAIVILRKHLESNPYDVSVLNNLGACLADIGNLAEAELTFELAFSLDDSYIPAVVNHGKMLIDRQRSYEGMQSLRQAKICEPYSSHVDTAYASLLFARGDASNAKQFKLRAWLADFDNLRTANCYLFYSSYADLDEGNLAAEHRFWAETTRRIELGSGSALKASKAITLPEVSLGVKKIRIGYWSPDFHNHSIRYFFRPLLEGHDLNKFEIFIYHDFLQSDEQTELIKAITPNFFQVFAMTDADLHDLVLSHDLDIFVELAGHSSHNRLPLLQNRFGEVQITALGYPPTTGLSTIDAKLLDRHICTENSARYYSESPLVMPSSFWCFNPMEEALIAPEPPATRNGFVTFACVGNIAKINSRMLIVWKTILERVENSRLLIRAINFNDKAAEDAIRIELDNAGISVARVDLRKPEAGPAFFGSYNEIDIVLDTFPFNGGTTTCFATYMGVPVISLSGASLVSRMGLSILSNLFVQHLAVTSEDAYIDCAVKLAQDIPYLRQFRQEVRARYENSCLGNGRLFAHEFESACIDLLKKKQSGVWSYKHEISLLPAEEIVRRAYAVLNHGQAEAAHRILAHCLEHYPDCGGAHLLIAQQWTGEDRFQDAINYLKERVDRFTHVEQQAALIYMARLYLLLDSPVNASQMLERISRSHVDDIFDQLQVKLYEACCASSTVTTGPVAYPPTVAKRIKIIIPCNEAGHFDAMQKQINTYSESPVDWTLIYQRCDEFSRIDEYINAVNDIETDVVLIIQKNVEIYNPRFFYDVVDALKSFDLIGIAGATRWQRLDWRDDDFNYKCAGYCIESSERAGHVEIQWQGVDRSKVVDNMSVLDGSLLALVPQRLGGVNFDKELLGADLLLEEDWSHTAFRSGKRLAVNSNLGVLIRSPEQSEPRSRALGRTQIVEKYKFDVFSTIKKDSMFVSAPVASVSEAFMVCNEFLEMLR